MAARNSTDSNPENATAIFPGKAFSRRGKGHELYLEEQSLNTLAERFGTPLYAYSKSAILEAYDAYASGLKPLSTPPVICVSVKANGNLSLLSILARRGAGFDVVSAGELERVIAAGGDPKRCVYSGVGKSADEIRFALRAGLLMFNVESASELRQINDIAGKEELRAPVALRINPDVDAKTHPYISTGMSEHKFGIPIDEAVGLYTNQRGYEHLDFVGVDCHIGSMITDLSAFRDAFARVSAFVERVRNSSPNLRYVDLGGGLAIPYKPSDLTSAEDYSIAAYTSLLRESLGSLGLTVVIEPGRSIFANAGVLISEVITIKNTATKTFMVVDSGFNDLIRPALYEAYHHIEPLQYNAGREKISADIVGPVCESGDCFAHDREILATLEGERVAFFSAGAYGFTMASSYNTRPRPAEILVDGDTATVIRPREEVRSLYESELTVLKSSAR